MRSTSVLEVEAGALAGKRFHLDVGRTIIGRHPSCGIVIEAVAVSRQHAVIGIEEDTAWIQDLGSRNGTVIDGKAVSGKRILADGEVIIMGDQRLKFSRHAGRPAGSPMAEGESGVTALVDDDGEPMIVAAVAAGQRPDESGVDHGSMLRASLELDRAIGAAVGLDEVLPRTLDGLFRIFPRAERGFLLLIDPNSHRLVVRASKFGAAVQMGPVILSRSLMDRVVRTQQAVLSADVSNDSRFDLQGSVAECGIRSVMCVPFVRADASVFGVLQIDRGDAREPFQREDLDLLGGLAGQVTRAIEQAQAHEERLAQEHLRRDLELAQRVQQGLLPAHPPEIPGYEAFDYYEPARQISGDFFGYIPLPDRRIAVVLADVSGKGMSAALVMAALSADVRYCLASEPDVARAVSRINESIYRSGWEDRFATMVVAVLDAGTHALTLVNAGHMPPLLRDAGGQVRDVGSEEAGLPLGVDPGQTYESLVLSLESGDTLVCYTDGISEAMDHAQRTYGTDRLRRVVSSATGGAAAVGRQILADVERHAAGQIRSDDICLVCLGRATAESP